MIIIKNISVFLLSLLIIVSNVRAQQQHHIPWPSLADSPWPIGRGDAQATGRSKYVGPRTANVLWRKDMPLGILYGPVIGYNDDLFVGTRALNSNAGENYFYSIDKNGDDIWTYVTEGNRANVAGATIVNDGTIYFSSLGTTSTGTGGIYAVNPDGTLKWRNKRFILGVTTRFLSVSRDGKIYIPYIDIVYILEPENGTVVDSFNLPNIAVSEIVFSVGGDTIYYISGRRFTADPKAINAATKYGEQLWSIALEDNNWGTPVVDNENRIYVFGVENGVKYLYCINPNGTIKWKFPFQVLEFYENYSSPSINKNGNILFPSGIFESPEIDSGYITSVDYDGNLSWKTTLGHYIQDGAFINHGLVCDAEGKIYCGSSTGTNTNFWCIDSDGTVLWKLDLEGYEFDSSPAIGSDGTLYIGTHLSSTFQNHIRNLIAVRDTVTFVENRNNEILSYHLEQNYPNPFNSTTHIRFSIPHSGRVTIKVYNILGREVMTLLDRYQSNGEYDVILLADELPSGIYFYKLTAGNFVDTKKLMLLK